MVKVFAKVAENFEVDLEDKARAQKALDAIFTWADADKDGYISRSVSDTCAISRSRFALPRSMAELLFIALRSGDAKIGHRYVARGRGGPQ